MYVFSSSVLTAGMPTSGRFARIGPQTLLVSDADFIRKINARGSSYKRSDWYKGGRFVPNEDTLLSMTEDSEHKALRTKMAPGVSVLVSRYSNLRESATDPASSSTPIRTITAWRVVLTAKSPFCST